MRLLLVHQNFPGQFRDLAPALVDRGHDVRAIGCSERLCDPRIPVRRYRLELPERQGLHAQGMEVDEWLRRGELAAREAQALKAEGWAPDVMLAHPGWGESLLLRKVFPASPLVIWPELWLRPEHMGLSEATASLEQQLYLRVKDWLVDGAMADAALAVLPTDYQASTFPERWQGKISVVHEGVQDALFDLPRLESLCLSDTVTLGPEVPVVTFISRNLEPMRGFPTFMQALPTLQRLHPTVEVVIVGGDEVSYSGRPADGGSWKQVLLQQLEGQLDLSRIHFFGRIPHGELIKLYRRSDLHVYLSAAFVLSWSLTEVLACGTAVLASANAMVRELVEPGVNGALWQGSPEGLGQAMADLVGNRDQLRRWGSASRERLAETHRTSHCVARLESLLQELANAHF